MTDTNAFFIDRQLEMSVGTRELAAPADDEALLRVQYAGLCGSDLHVMRSGAWVEESEWPATLGHEICAVVERAPADGSLQAGDRVVADSRVPCGTCAECAAGVPDRCTAVRFVGECRPGGFAGLCVLPSSLLHRIPDELVAETAVLAEPLAVAMHGLSRLAAQPRRVAVLGHGPIGALVQIELRRRFPDAEVTVAEPVPLRAQLARALGAEVVDTAADLPGHRYDTVVDAAGYGSSMTDALHVLAPRGQLLLVALGHQPLTITPAEIVEAGATIAGANAFVDELPDAIDALAAEPARYAPVVTDTISLDELPAMARAQLQRPEAVKVIVCP
jgi:2-desacetyl-2-hydroxyethyl bacteriochlorophyllide A dehydrogenase